MSEAAQMYVGEDRFVVRKKIINDLRIAGNFVKSGVVTVIGVKVSQSVKKGDSILFLIQRDANTFFKAFKIKN